MTAMAGLLVWLLGLCIGSFLNVVVYRLPAGLSVMKPTWSFCPTCNATLKWFDNIPLLSWLLLGGRCRSCRTAISSQYPLVEAVTGLVFVLTYHLLVVEQARVGVPVFAWPTDVPLLLAWLALAGALVACSAMDIVSYLIDTAITNIAVVVGIVLMAVWPRPQVLVEQASSPAAAGAVVAFLVSIVMLWLTVWRREPTEPRDEPIAGAGLRNASMRGGQTPVGNAASNMPKSGGPAFGISALVVLAMAALTVGMLFLPAAAEADSLRMLTPAAFVVLFAMLVLSSGQPREADAELHAAIEDESPQARRLALVELAWLLPAIVLGGGLAFAMTKTPALADAWRSAVSWSPTGGVTPLAGIAVAVLGVVIAAAAGWAVRILFTLAFGREAFGTGDIYILAAAGATAGWDIALLGFLFGIGLALLAWLVGLFLKKTVMIAFGPPLALGFLVALWLNRPAADKIGEYADLIAIAWRQDTSTLSLMGGLLLVSAVGAVALARLMRRFVEPRP